MDQLLKIFLEDGLPFGIISFCEFILFIKKMDRSLERVCEVTFVEGTVLETSEMQMNRVLASSSSHSVH